MTENKPMSDREKALEILGRLRTKGRPGKRWRNTGYFNVPGVVMQELAKEGKCEMRKLHGSAPTKYRP